MVWGAIILGGNFPVEYFSWGSYPGDNYPGSNCAGGNCPRTLNDTYLKKSNINIQ